MTQTKKGRKPLKRLSFEDRKLIQKMTEKEIPIAVIADTVGVHKNSIYNELRRCPANKYDAEKAQLSLR